MTHPTQTVDLYGQPTQIDEEIVPLIKAMHEVGIQTMQSCQNMDGRVWIQLGDVDDLSTLMSAVTIYDQDPDSIFERLTDWEVGAPHWDESPRNWRYTISPYPLDGNGDVWPAKWSFTALVEFPPSDLPEVSRRVEEFARCRSDEECCMQESDEVAAHARRAAQARRLLRLCAELGVKDPEDLTPEQIAPALDEHGMIRPEPEDLSG